MNLDQLLTELRDYSGIQQKLAIQNVGESLALAHPHYDHPNGDDTAVIINGDHYDLFAIEGLYTPFVEADPWFAGWCSVMVNCSDIASMGGKPTAVVNALWGRDDETSKKILQGMSDASAVFEVPIVGGHTHLNSDQPQLAVSILGRANTLLSSFAARPRQLLVAAIDLRGAYRQPFLNWNAATDAPPERLRADFSLLPIIADTGLACAAKDISQAGLLGTALMLSESSDVGATIDLDNIPKPDQVSWDDWLRSFPSFGYLLATDESKLDPLLDTFQQRDIHAAAIGRFTDSKRLIIHHDKQRAEFWNLHKQPLTGMKKPANKIHQTPINGEQPYARYAL